MRGDDVGVPDTESEVLELAKEHKCDSELLAYAIRCVQGKERDNRLVTTLKSSLNAWVANKRDEWSELRITGQTALAANLAMSNTTFEDAVRARWGSSRLFAGIGRATRFAKGQLAWGRSIAS